LIENKDILELCDEMNSEYSSIEVDLNNLGKYNINAANKPSNNVTRKFEETFNVNDYEVLSHKGFVSIKRIGKTIPYLKYIIKTDNYELECADEHIVIDDTYDEIFVKELNVDSRPDKIITETGPEIVREVINTGFYENMYDIELGEGSDHLYYTSGILSHNSIWLANDAATFVRMGYNTAVISAEMAAHKFVKRIGANLLNITMGDYDAKSKDLQFMKTQLARVGVGLQPPGRLFVKKYPTSQATVIDIENYLVDVEQTTGIKLKAVIIDYINILSNYRNPNGDSTYMKIKQIAEDLRAMGDRNQWLIVTATQIKRSGYESSDISMDDIAESAGLSHTADMMYGIIQDPIMHANYEYWLKIIKIRDGEGKNTKCRFNIDYNYMRLTETDDVRSPGAGGH
jgi:replicative DNA helicase